MRQIYQVKVATNKVEKVPARLSYKAAFLKASLREG